MDDGTPAKTSSCGGFEWKIVRLETDVAWNAELPAQSPASRRELARRLKTHLPKLTMEKPLRKAHILFLFSDTGGAISAAETIIEALRLDFGERITTKMVDFSRNVPQRR
jgi:hypothetical protein